MSALAGNFNRCASWLSQGILLCVAINIAKGPSCVVELAKSEKWPNSTNESIGSIKFEGDIVVTQRA